MSKEEFIEALKELDIVLSEEKFAMLDTYYTILVQENEKMNLTSITEKSQVYLKHFYDSLTLIKAINLNKVESLCDIGTGAGFPGLVLKIVFPTLKVTLVDALNKRILFLDSVIQKLGLTNIKTVHARMEDYARENREIFDVVTARAVAPLKELLEYGTPTVKVGGNLIFMKGTLKEEEIFRIEDAMQKLSLKEKKIYEFKLPIEESNRTLISFKKTQKTAKKYPRKYFQIKNCSL